MKILKEYLRYFTLTVFKSGSSIKKGVLIYCFLFLMVSFLLWIPNNETAQYNESILVYIIRSMIVIIPASVAIFTFAYKENKENAYARIKTSNIHLYFSLLNTAALLTIFFSIILLVNSDVDKTLLLPFIAIITHSLITVYLAILYIRKLILSMDLTNTINGALNVAEKAIQFLEKNYNNKFFSNSQLNEAIKIFESHNEVAFHSYNSLINKGHYSGLSSHHVRIRDLNKRYLSIFINSDYPKDLESYLKRKDVYILKGEYVSKLDGTNTKDIIENYTNILLNFRLVIRNATKHKLTSIQNELINSYFFISPLEIFEKKEIGEYESEELEELYNKILDSYFSLTFELITELCDEDTVEYSYLLDKVSDAKIPLTLLKLYKGKKKPSLLKKYYEKLMVFMESLLVWSLESKNLYYLTESSNLLLELKEHVYGKHDEENDIEESESKINLEQINSEKNDDQNEEILNMFDNKGITTKVMEDHIDKQHLIEFDPDLKKSLLDIYFVSLLKSIEIGAYGCTGFIIKIIISNFNTSSIESSISHFYDERLKVGKATIDHSYFHYSISKQSENYCLDKLLIMVCTHTLYRKQKYILLWFISQNINQSKINHYINKIQNAKNKYGLLSVNKSIYGKFIMEYNKTQRNSS
ncbi:hypothetical protein EQV77_00970 [Halobacillus fulvus]|nr:hypothetical protein EQV77_00970 [Halobacillus fulvus]